MVKNTKTETITIRVTAVVKKLAEKRAAAEHRSHRGRCQATHLMPTPARILVTVMSKMAVTLQALPALVSRDGSNLRNGPAHFEQPRDALMAHVVSKQFLIRL